MLELKQSFALFLNERAVTHSGDCRDGSLPGDDEVITMRLSSLDSRVKKLVFVVTINEAKQRGLNYRNDHIMLSIRPENHYQLH